MKSISFILGVCLILSCNNTNTKSATQAVAPAAPTETSQPKPINAPGMQRVIVDNPEEATVSIQLKSGKWFETTEKYAETMIEPLESFRVYIDGSKYNDPTIKPTENILINVTKQKYKFAQLIYVENKLSNRESAKENLKSVHGTTIISGYDLGPNDVAPETAESRNGNASFVLKQLVKVQ